MITPWKKRKATKRTASKGIKKYKVSPAVPMTWAITRPSMSLSAPLPTTLKTRLVYCEQISVNPGIGGIIAVHVFRANSLFDPDFTNVGHQPRGFDQLMTMYREGVVTFATIECLFGRTNSDTTQVVCGCTVRDTTTASTNVFDYTELPKTVTDYKLCSTNAGLGVCRTYMSVNQAKYLGITSILSDATVRFTSGGNPVRDLAFHVWATDLQAVDSNAVFVYCTLTFDVVFTEPQIPPQS